MAELYSVSDSLSEDVGPLYVRHMAWAGCDAVTVIIDTHDSDYDGRELHLRALDAAGRVFSADDGGMDGGNGEGLGLDVVALHTEVDACVVVGVEGWRIFRAVPDAVNKVCVSSLHVVTGVCVDVCWVTTKIKHFFHRKKCLYDQIIQKKKKK